MKLQQLRYLCEVARDGFSMSRAAGSLGTSQPAISKQIRLLELELGVDLLIRKGNRIVGLTAAGEATIEAAQRTVWESQNLKRITEEFTNQGSGRLVIATTHLYARYVLRPVIKEFTHTHPHVQLVLLQGIPSMIAQWVAAGEADMGISGKPPENHDELLYLPCAKLDRSIFVPKRHPLGREGKVTLGKIAQFPIITLDRGLEGGRMVIRAFEAAQIKPNIVLSAIDADIVKCYVELGLGIAVLLSIAYEPERDRKLAVIRASHLFEPTITQIIVRSGKHLPSYMRDFIHKFAPQWHAAALNTVVRSTSNG